MGASFLGIPASYKARKRFPVSKLFLHIPSTFDAAQFTFNSAMVKPRPARTRRLYLMVGHRTTGRSLSTGRGATAAALAMRASRRRCFRPGCAIHVSRPNSYPAKKIFPRFQVACDIVRNNKKISLVGEMLDSRTWSKCTRTRRCQSLWKSIQEFVNHCSFKSDLPMSSVGLKRSHRDTKRRVTHGSSESGCCA